MAQRRLFSLKIIDTDAFLDMPVSARELYFQLSMRADDDGFVGNHKKILRMTGSTDDDMKILLAKRFVLSFESGVVVIKHWLIHNSIRADRYKETLYKKEKSLLGFNEYGAYTEKREAIATIGIPNGNQMETKWQPNGNQMEPQVKLSKVKLSKVKRDKGQKPSSTINYLKQIPKEDLEEFSNRYIITWAEIINKAQGLIDYCEMHGKVYKNYKAFLRNAISKDFQIREKRQGKSASELVEEAQKGEKS